MGTHDTEHNRDQSQLTTIAPVFTSFVGRESALTDLAALVCDSQVRLITITGPAGVGKTRLAVTLGETLSHSFTDGVHVIPFASLRDDSLVPFGIADALGLVIGGKESLESVVINHFREQECLVVLDNLEHLLPIPFVTRLLTACAGVTILATSRERLNLSGEHLYPLSPLAIPGIHTHLSSEDLANVDSVRLLVDRARQIDPSFALTDENARHIARICTRLDGLPLAIELAAAPLRALSPSALLDRLQDRLALLSGGPGDQPEHQRTLRGAIDWSYDLLSADEQSLFRRLSVFSGGFSTESAVSMSGLGGSFGIEVLLSLVNKSLITAAESGSDQSRLRMLESIRLYAAEQLFLRGESDGARLEHASHFLALVQEAMNHVPGPDQATHLQRVDDDYSNVRTALETLRSASDIRSYASLVVALWRYWRTRGMFREGRHWLTFVTSDLSLAELDHSLRSAAQFSSGWFALELGETDDAARLGAKAEANARTADEPTAIARALTLLSFIDSRLDKNDAAMDRMREALEHFTAANDADAIAGTLNNLAILSLDTGRWEDVLEFSGRSRIAFAGLGNVHGESHAIDTMGIALYCLGRFEEAMVCSQESLAIDAQLDDMRGRAISLDHIGKCARALGDLEEAWRAHKESIALRIELGDPRGISVWLEAMANWLCDAGQHDMAAKILGTLEINRISTNIPLQLHEAADHQAAIDGVRTAIGEDAFERLAARGRWISMQEMVTQVVAFVEDMVTTEMGASPTAALRNLVAIHHLTPREAEIIALMGERLTDREIADRLYISPRTVAHHVGAILRKLDIHTRREAAALIHPQRTSAPEQLPTSNR